MMLALSNRKTGPGLTVIATAAGSGTVASGGQVGGFAPVDQDADGAAVAAHVHRERPASACSRHAPWPAGRRRRRPASSRSFHRLDAPFSVFSTSAFLAGNDEVDGVFLRLADGFFRFVRLLLSPEMNTEQFERRRMRRRNQGRARENHADKQGAMPQRQYFHRHSSTRWAGIEPIFMGRVVRANHEQLQAATKPACAPGSRSSRQC